MNMNMNMNMNTNTASKCTATATATATAGAYMLAYPVAAVTGSAYSCKINNRRNTMINTKKNKSVGAFSQRHHYLRNQFQKNFREKLVCQATEQAQSQSPIVYEGAYGPWTIDPSDIQEVILYRSGLVTAAISFVLASSTAFLPDSSFLRDTLDQSLDPLYLLGTAGLGLSLYLIHIYVTEIKRFLQALWALGVFGSIFTYVALAQPNGEGLVQYVIHNPLAVWLVGPVFAALTGLVFKEGLCYGKLEAAVLAIIIPITLVGHLTGIMDDTVKLSLLGVWTMLFIIFAGRKFTQPIKDDIGDKSVFIFNALPEEKKAAMLEKLEHQRL